MSLTDDLLKGADDIAGFTGLSRRVVYHLHECGSIPTFQLPGSKILFARKSELEQHFTASHHRQSGRPSFVEPPASADTHPKDGDAVAAPLESGAAPAGGDAHA